MDAAWLSPRGQRLRKAICVPACSQSYSSAPLSSSHASRALPQFGSWEQTGLCSELGWLCWVAAAGTCFAFTMACRQGQLLSWHAQQEQQQWLGKAGAAGWLQVLSQGSSAPGLLPTHTSGGGEKAGEIIELRC